MASRGACVPETPRPTLGWPSWPRPGSAESPCPLRLVDLIPFGSPPWPGAQHPSAGSPLHAWPPGGIHLFRNLLLVRLQQSGLELDHLDRLGVEDGCALDVVLLVMGLWFLPPEGKRRIHPKVGDLLPQCDASFLGHLFRKSADLNLPQLRAEPDLSHQSPRRPHELPLGLRPIQLIPDDEIRNSQAAPSASMNWRGQHNPSTYIASTCYLSKASGSLRAPKAMAMSPGLSP